MRGLTNDAARRTMTPVWGTCVDSRCVFGRCNSTLVCDCDAGYAYDQSGIHSGALNCARPESAYLGVMIADVVIATACNAFLCWCLHARKRNGLFDMTLMVIAINTLSIISTVSTYAQDGMYEGACVAFMFISVCFSVWSYRLLASFVDAVFSIHPQTARVTKTVLSTIAFFFSVLWIACGSALVATCRTSDYAFNAALSTAYGFSAVACFAYAALFWRQSTVLLRMLSDSTRNADLVKSAVPDINRARIRIMRHRRVMGSLFVNLTFALPLIPIVYASLGQFPFQWVLNMLISFGTVLTLTAGMYVLLTRTKLSSDAHSGAAGGAAGKAGATASTTTSPGNNGHNKSSKTDHRTAGGSSVVIVAHEASMSRAGSKLSMVGSVS